MQKEKRLSQNNANLRSLFFSKNCFTQTRTRSDSTDLSCTSSRIITLYLSAFNPFSRISSNNTPAVLNIIFDLTQKLDTVRQYKSMVKQIDTAQQGVNCDQSQEEHNIRIQKEDKFVLNPIRQIVKCLNKGLIESEDSNKIRQASTTLRFNLGQSHNS